jgi:hypothetical protein
MQLDSVYNFGGTILIVPPMQLDSVYNFGGTISAPIRTARLELATSSPKPCALPIKLSPTVLLKHRDHDYIKREDGTDGLEPAVDRLKADALSSFATCHK